MRWCCSLLLFLLLMGCTADVPTPTPAFYHWASRLDLPTEPLRAVGAERLYIKVCDVSLQDGSPRPDALLLADSLPDSIEAVPVVFITNEVFTRPTESLAADLLGLIGRRFPGTYPELQIDCDWTAGTRTRYFNFLNELRELAGVPLSCTVRLHQYRDRERQGVPPVDRAVLMAYNTGDLDRWETDNSILDPQIIDAYIEGQPSYPLPLDLAVAAYDWAAVYRREALAYLINEPELEALADTGRFTRLSPTRYRLDSSTYYGGLYLYRDDHLRLEGVTATGARDLGARLWPRVANAGSRFLIYYHVGSRQWE